MSATNVEVIIHFNNPEGNRIKTSTFECNRHTLAACMKEEQNQARISGLRPGQLVTKRGVTLSHDMMAVIFSHPKTHSRQEIENAVLTKFISKLPR